MAVRGTPPSTAAMPEVFVPDEPAARVAADDQIGSAVAVQIAR